jgi:CRP/FNR family transcriptional regulator
MGLSVLTTADLYRGIAPADVDRIGRLFAERKYPRGTTIYARGDPGDALYIVKEGLVKLVAHSGRGTETILHILPPGALFGEILLSEEKRAFTAVANTDTVVATLPKQSLVQLLATIPAFSANLIRHLSRRLAKVEREFAEFGHTWSYHRLAKVLLQLAQEHGVKGPRGTALSLPLTHEELANLIGTTRETVTTQLGRFRRMGLIRREGRTFVLNVPRLVRFTREEEPAGEGAEGG